MATNNRKENKQMHSGFEGYEGWKMEPKGTRIKKNPDGTITLIPPKKTNTTKKNTPKGK